MWAVGPSGFQSRLAEGAVGPRRGTKSSGGFRSLPEQGGAARPWGPWEGDLGWLLALCRAETFLHGCPKTRGACVRACVHMCARGESCQVSARGERGLGCDWGAAGSVLVGSWGRWGWSWERWDVRCGEMGSVLWGNEVYRVRAVGRWGLCCG